MKNIYKILKLSKPYYIWFGVISVIVVVQAVLQQVTPITFKFVVDELTKQISDGSGDFDKLIGLFGLILTINILLVVLNVINQRIGDYVSSRLGKFLSEFFYERIFTLPQRYFDGEISGRIINLLSRGILSIRDFLGAASNFIMPALLQAIFGVAVLSYFDLTIGLLALAVFPVYIAISSYSTKKWGEIQAKKNEHEDAARGRIQEVITNIKLVRTYNTQQSEWQFIRDKYSLLNRLYDLQSNRYHVLNFIREFFVEIAFVVIFYLIFRSTFAGTLTLGEMILIIQILNQLRWPLFAMSYILEQVQRAEADSKAFFEVTELESAEEPFAGIVGPVSNFSQKMPKHFIGSPSVAATHNKKQKRNLSEELPNQIKKPAISFNSVSFAYQDGPEVLKAVSFELKDNETVALVGHSGAGKTTMINLIAKFYEATGGEIALNGKSYSTLDHSFVRQHIALVFQDNELFSSTIRENVAYGMNKVTDDQVWKALKQANADEFVKKFKGGLDSEIGERGVKLSGGQKQRLQIARAILHDRPILILDEATSSLDAKSERLVQEALEILFKNRLVLIIAHRFSTIQDVDRIIVLENGRIADSGKPKELAKRPGLYSELLRYQVEGNKKLLSEYELY